jgi:hypothetical protein
MSGEYSLHENEKFGNFYFVKPNQKEPHGRIILKLLYEKYGI